MITVSMGLLLKGPTSPRVFTQRVMMKIVSHTIREAFDYFDFIAWVESKMQNRPLADVINAKAG